MTVVTNKGGHCDSGPLRVNMIEIRGVGMKCKLGGLTLYLVALYY